MNFRQAGKVVCFGEVLLRLSPAAGGQWLEQNCMPVYIGGAEANVATALAHWDIPVKYGTVVPDHYLAREAVAYLEQRKIDISAIQFSGNRLGQYFLGQGDDLRNAGVIYDRDHSSFFCLMPGMLDWEKILDGATWLHFSAISPALNQQLASVCREGLELASHKNMTISIDLNYRPKLWQYGLSPVEIMPDLVQFCHLVMGNIWSASSLLGIPVDPSIHAGSSRSDYLEQARITALEVLSRFPACQAMANTFRFDQGREGIRYYATLQMRGQEFHSPIFDLESILDPVGSGDCFMAGLIYGFRQDLSPQHTLEFAAAAAIGKLLERGDATRQTTHFIQKYLQEHAR
ncbi:MAG: PfkB family carbohydrate kinase [Chitinophagaceae bacterium]